MDANDEKGFQGIAEILATIQKMRAEKQSLTSRLEGIRAPLSADEDQSIKQENDRFCSLDVEDEPMGEPIVPKGEPIIYESESFKYEGEAIASEAAPIMSEGEPIESNVISFQDICDGAAQSTTEKALSPRRELATMKDTRYMNIAVKAWPGLRQISSGQSSCQKNVVTPRASCFGPVLSPDHFFEIGHEQFLVVKPIHNSHVRSDGESHLQGPSGPKMDKLLSAMRTVQETSVVSGQEIYPQEPAPSRTQPNAIAPSNGAGTKADITEVSALLLRPLIMQWVNDNMPLIVENALSIKSSSR